MFEILLSLLRIFKRGCSESVEKRDSSSWIWSEKIYGGRAEIKRKNFKCSTNVEEYFTIVAPKSPTGSYQKQKTPQLHALTTSYPESKKRQVRQRPGFSFQKSTTIYFNMASGLMLFCHGSKSPPGKWVTWDFKILLT